MFTSLEDGIWVKFYDKGGRQLMQKQMALNERYVVPAQAEGPQVWTGRPDALQITVGGKPAADVATRVQQACIQHDLLLLTCGSYENVIRWIPPLVVTQAQIDEALDLFAEALGQATST